MSWLEDRAVVVITGAAVTVGGVVGALRGADGTGERWTAPLAGRIATPLPGGEQHMADLAARTVAPAEPVTEAEA